MTWELKNLGQMADSVPIHLNIQQTGVLEMLSHKSFGIAGAAMLGTVAFLGTNAANAVIDLDGTGVAVTFVKETVMEKVGDTDYYKIDGGDEALDVTVAAGITGASGDKVYASFMLAGMIFTGDSRDTDAETDMIGNVSGRYVTGGDEGDTEVIYEVTLTADLGKTDTVALKLEDLGISAAGSGSISVQVANQTGAAVLTSLGRDPSGAMNSKSRSGAVTLKSVVKETLTPNNLEAKVEASFMAFGTDPAVLMGTLGSVAVTPAAETYLSAVDGSPVQTLSLVIADGGSGANMVADDGSSVVISGDFSFAEAAWLDNGEECNNTVGGDGLEELVDLRQVDDDGMVESMDLQTQSLGYVATNPHLCISVVETSDEAAVAIPLTEPYMVKTSYGLIMAFEDSAFPTPDGGGNLGRITHNGTTVYIPYITTYEGHNNRIVLTNRGGDAKYMITYTPEDGTMATPGLESEGMLAKGTKVLSVSNGDLVEITGKTKRTAATVIVETEPGNIDVVTVVVNRGDQSTDTVVYDHVE